MKVATLAVVASGIWSVAAQNRADYLPECALKCLDDATKRATNCALDDAVCWCVQKNYEDIYNAGVTCVLDTCGSDKAIKQVLPGAAKFCAAATASAKAAASSTPAPTASTTQPASGADGNSTGHVTTGPTSSPASTGASSSSNAKSTTASPAAAASSGPIAGAVLLLAGALAAL